MGEDLQIIGMFEVNIEPETARIEAMTLEFRVFNVCNACLHMSLTVNLSR